MNVLGARADSDEAGRKLAEHRKIFQETRYERQGGFAGRFATGDHMAMDESLYPLN